MNYPLTRERAFGAGLIAGSGRSGTTWVQDTLATANGLRTVFEPRHPGGSSIARSRANLYLRRDTLDVELQEFFASVFAGTLRSIWTDYRIRPDRLRPRLDAL